MSRRAHLFYSEIPATIRLLILLIAHYFHACCGLNASKTMQTFSIGGFYSVPQQQFLTNWRPIFENYLNNVVGSRLDPQVNFKLIPVDFVPTAQSADLFAAGKLDFICKPIPFYTRKNLFKFLHFRMTHLHVCICLLISDSHPVAIACLSATFNVAPLVTQRTWAQGAESGSYGAVFIALKSNTAIQSIVDFPGRRMGTGGILSVTFQETWKVRILRLSTLVDPS